jgi:hypothetical protein
MCVSFVSMTFVELALQFTVELHPGQQHLVTAKSFQVQGQFSRGRGAGLY